MLFVGLLSYSHVSCNFVRGRSLRLRRLEAMNPFVWLILAEYFISLVSQLLSLFIFGDILFKSFFSNCRATVFTSPSLNFYFITQTCASFVASVYLLYLLVGWRPDFVEYNAYFMYFIGACQSLLITSTPVSVFALGLDRCLCVLFPMKYTKRQNSYPTYFAILLMAILTTISLLFRIIPAYPMRMSTPCGSFGCMTTTKALEIYVFIRYFTSAIILATSVTLLILIRRKLHIYLAHNKAGKVSISLNCILTWISPLTPMPVNLSF